MRELLLPVFILLTIAHMPRAEAQDAPGRFVDMENGRRLHLVCEGEGSPTIVFESGSGEGWYTWALVQKPLSREHRTCSYDRAGIGFSDPRTGRTVTALNIDLHELLVRAGEKPPYVFVGHSLGGILVRRYAARYSSDVAGMVLVDSAHEEFDLRFPPLPEEREQIQAAREARRTQIESWRASGRWPQMEFDDAVPRRLRDLLGPRSGSATGWDARFAESGMSDTYAPLSREQRQLNCPLAVITATATKWPRPPWRTTERHEAWLQARKELQEELASRSRQSRHILVDSTHSVQLDRPDAVIKAVQEIARMVPLTEN